MFAELVLKMLFSTSPIIIPYFLVVALLLTLMRIFK